MTFTANDWQALRKAILTLAAISLLGIALVFLSHRELVQTRALLVQKEAALREAQQRLYKSGEEKERILRYRPGFIALQEQGFIGEEQRINWVDALRAASLHLKMFGVNYQIEAQQPYAAPFALDIGPYRAYQSLMKVNMGLLHEEDLMHFLNSVDEQRAGIFSLRECSLQRLGAAKGELMRVQANLQAECSLVWLTMSEANQGGAL